MTTAAAHDGEARRCRDLMMSYHHCIDVGRATAAIDYFTDDAHFEGNDQVLQGREEILRFLAERESANEQRQTIHVLTNDVVTHADADRVEIRALVLLHVRRPDGTYALQRATDVVHEFRRGARGWLITRRSATHLHPAA